MKEKSIGESSNADMRERSPLTGATTGSVTTLQKSNAFESSEANIPNNALPKRSQVNAERKW